MDWHIELAWVSFFLSVLPQKRRKEKKRKKKRKEKKRKERKRKEMKLN
jgi:hypothetical protein